MRLAYSLTSILAFAAACGGSDGPSDDEFTDVGGTLAIENCGYSVTSRLGAEPPRVATTTLGSDPTPRLVHLGLVGDPRTSIVAQWRTADETTRATVLRFAVGADLPEDQLTEQVTGIQFGYRATGTEIYRVHQAHVCGLAAGTTYSYQVGAEGHFSPVYTFRTAPDVTANPDAELVFGVIGDSRDGYDVWSQLVAQLEQRAPDLVLFTGDAVTAGITQYEWEDFLGRAESLFARVPVVFAQGNHEVNAVNFYSQFAMPGDQETFSFDYGHAHITVANDTPDDISVLTGETRDRLAADFEASKDARWRILMHHQSMWSAATAHGSSLFLQENWQPLVDQYHLDLVIAGHDHDFEISKPMIGQTPQTTNTTATVYAVVGGAGAELYGNQTLFHTAYSESTHSASTLRVRRDLLELEAFRPDGTAISAPGARFTKTK
jgi:predicted phosphodiesterase